MTSRDQRQGWESRASQQLKIIKDWEPLPELTDQWKNSLRVKVEILIVLDTK